MKGLIAKKVGMTQVFDENGNLTPVTVIRVEPNTVVATKTQEKCGYEAVVLGLEDLKPHKITKPYAKQFPENITPKRHLKEFRDFEGDVKVGDQIGVEMFEKIRFIDVTATSKGKGFQGVMKRWGFHGGVMSVPESAIEFDGDNTYVYIINGSGDKKTYDRRKVTTGLSDGINIEIKSGIKANERVRGPKKVSTED